MSQNLSPLDRLIRVGLGLAIASGLLAATAQLAVHPAWWLLPGALLATGIAGHCPLHGLARRLLHRT
jgi:fatty acid desaturase